MNSVVRVRDDELMSNILTEYVRIFARPGHRIFQYEAEWIAVNVTVGPDGDGRSTYFVPVHLRIGADRRWVDIQYGCGKGHGLWDFWDRYGDSERYEALWVRLFDEGSDHDVIEEGPGPDRRFCRYGFDELRVTMVDERPPVGPPELWDRLSGRIFRAKLNGSYRTGNGRTDSHANGDVGLLTPLTEPTEPWLATPTTPCCRGTELAAVEPDWLEPLADYHPDVTEMEYRWRGRVVHRARHEQTEYGPDWQHRNADDWDNCLDPRYLAATGMTELLSSSRAYRRDEQDWAASRHH
jgi:hypothetical protein